MPRHPDPDLEQRILDAASRLWARGGEKALTMRAVAKAAGTTTPTVYERYRDRDDILRALRLQTRRELFAALSRTRHPARGGPALPRIRARTQSRLRSTFRRRGQASFPARALAVVQSHARASGPTAGRKSPATHAPHARGLVADARHRHAHHPRPIRGRAAHPDRPRLPGRLRCHPRIGRAIEGPGALRPEVAVQSDSGRRRSRAAWSSEPKGKPKKKLPR